MLVLTRRANRGDLSVVLIGEEVTVEVMSTENGEVRLGVTAPSHMAVSKRLEDSKADNKQVRRAARRLGR